MTQVRYYDIRQNFHDRVAELTSLKRYTAEAGWDLGDAPAIPSAVFNNAIFLIGRIGYERTPEVQVSTNGNVGLFFGGSLFQRGTGSKVLTVVVILRGNEIKVGTLFRDGTEASTGFREANIDNLKKTADYINGIGKNGQDRI